MCQIVYAVHPPSPPSHHPEPPQRHTMWFLPTTPRVLTVACRGRSPGSGTMCRLMVSKCSCTLMRRRFLYSASLGLLACVRGGSASGPNTKALQFRKPLALSPCQLLRLLRCALLWRVRGGGCTYPSSCSAASSSDPVSGGEASERTATWRWPNVVLGCSSKSSSNSEAT